MFCWNIISDEGVMRIFHNLLYRNYFNIILHTVYAKYNYYKYHVIYIV